MNRSSRPGRVGLLAAGLVAALAGGGLVADPVAAAVSPDASVVISEAYGGGGNNGAAYNRDFVELHNRSAAPIDLATWSVQYTSATGAIWQVTPLGAVTIEPGDYLLVGQATGADVGLPGFDADIDGSIPMSGAGGKVALVSTGTALNGGVGIAGLPEVVDYVGWGGAADYAGSGPAPATTNATSVARDAAVTNTADNAHDFTAATPTPGAPAVDPDPAPEPDPEAATISQIQGTGAASPYAGRSVTTTGVVTASYPTGGLAGYVIQTPGSGGDVDLASHTASDAIFIYSPGLPVRPIGAYVSVTGAVSEFGGAPGAPGLTEITAAAVVPVGEPFTPPAPAPIAWPASESLRESLESMLIAPQGEYTVTNTFGTNQYGEVGIALGDDPLRQPTDVAEPRSPEAAAVTADNAARAVTLDDGASTNFLASANRNLTPSYVSLTEPVVVGGTVGFDEPVVVDWRNGVWKLNPTAPVIGDGSGDDGVTFTNPRTPAPVDVGGDLSIASFNVLNYFTTLGTQISTCVPFADRTGDGVTVASGCDLRGAWDSADLQRQQDKTVAAINALDAHVVGLIEMENSARLGEAPDEATATLVAALNAAAGAAKWAYIPSSAELPDPAVRDVITNAIIYQPAAATPVGASRALGTQSGEGQSFSNAREPVAQVFRPARGGETLLFVVNHFKSKSGPAAGVVVAAGDEDAGDGQSWYNAARVNQAAALDAWVEQIRGDTKSVALVGDFNSYGQEDPLQVLYASGYTDAEAAFALDESSYSFSGLSGSLDHVLLSEAALDRATGADIWNINSGESVALEYSRYNYHGQLFYAPDPYRSSDHDPVIVGLTAGVDERAASQTRLFSIPPVHINRLLPSVLVALVTAGDSSSARGTVEFREGDTVVGSATVNRGVATLVLPRTLSRGIHTYTATFVPTDAEAMRGSTSPPVRIRVLG